MWTSEEHTDVYSMRALENLFKNTGMISLFKLVTYTCFSQVEKLLCQTPSQSSVCLERAAFHDCRKHKNK